MGLGVPGPSISPRCAGALLLSQCELWSSIFPEGTGAEVRGWGWKAWWEGVRPVAVWCVTQPHSAAVESAGVARAEAQARAEAARIEGEAAILQAKLKAEAVAIETVRWGGA